MEMNHIFRPFPSPVCELVTTDGYAKRFDRLFSHFFYNHNLSTGGISSVDQSSFLPVFLL